MNVASSSQTGPSQVMDPDPSQMMIDPTQFMQEQFDRLQHEELQHHEGHEGQEEEGQQEQPQDSFSGGPYVLYLLPEFRSHIAYRVWIEPEIRNKVIDVVGAGKRLYYSEFVFPDSRHVWFWDVVEASGLGDLLKTSYKEINNAMVTALVERWHPETSSFHLPVGEMTVTLDDEYCLLNIPIQGIMLDFDMTVDRERGVRLMMELLGITEPASRREVKEQWEGYIRYETLRHCYQGHLQSVDDLERDGDPRGFLRHHQRCCIRGFLLYVVGNTLFTNKTKKHVDLIFLEGMRDVNLINQFSWGDMTLATLYNNLSEASHPGPRCTSIAGYMTLLVAWAMEHLKDYFPHKLYKRYTQDLPRARKWEMTKRGHAIPDTYKRYLDDLGVNKCIWNPYVDHRKRYPLLEVAWYRGWIMCGRGRMARHLPDRVLRQFVHVQKIPRHPTHYVPQMAPPDIIQAFIHFQNHVIPRNQRGRECRVDRP